MLSDAEQSWQQWLQQRQQPQLRWRRKILPSSSRCAKFHLGLYLHRERDNSNGDAEPNVTHVAKYPPHLRTSCKRSTRAIFVWNVSLEHNVQHVKRTSHFFPPQHEERSIDCAQRSSRECYVITVAFQRNVACLCMTSHMRTTLRDLKMSVRREGAMNGHTTRRRFVWLVRCPSLVKHSQHWLRWVLFVGRYHCQWQSHFHTQ